LKRKFGILIALVLAISLLTVPTAALAGSGVGLDVGVYTNTLVLENKVLGVWQPVSDDIGGLLGYNAAADEFEWALEATVLLPDTDYALIYYADKPDRFVDWGGDNPGALIGVVGSDPNGDISAFGSVELNMDLPCPPDANQFEIAYNVTPDFYDNAHGAKIWLVPASYLPTSWPNDGGWMTWSADIVSNILFETNLIWYDDTSEDSNIVSVSVNPNDIDFGILIPGDTGSAPVTVTVGNIPTTVKADGSGLGSAFANMTVDTVAPASYDVDYAAYGSASVALSFTATATYGQQSGTLIFIATATP